MAQSRIDCNLGFDGRIFLTEAEWRTYLRRKPVRYICKAKASKCEVCGGTPEDGNPFENAHRIAFDTGIVRLALTPDFLDEDANVVTAHRTKCNKVTELTLEDAMRFLRSFGVTELPAFLPEEVRLRGLAWRRRGSSAGGSFRSLSPACAAVGWSLFTGPLAALV